MDVQVRIGVKPTVIIDGYKFRFYSSDQYEPPHMHVIQAERAAKIWLQLVEAAYNWRYNQAELNHISTVIRENQAFLLET
ncbi:MAG TPA: DUF4160 domain-containing protein [Candidatus Latescibacteria bacterium]|nr:DUF4160 domain-containing protein [Candidatus Latescibacterota bacterium]